MSGSAQVRDTQILVGCVAELAIQVDLNGKNVVVVSQE